MKVLLLYPRFPKTFWSYDEFMKIAGLKAFIPALGILTVAAMLQQTGKFGFMTAMLIKKRMLIGNGAT